MHICSLRRAEPERRCVASRGSAILMAEGIERFFGVSEPVLTIRIARSLLASGLAFALMVILPTIAAERGRFVGRLEMVAVPRGDSEFELLKDFEYQDGNGRRWRAPKGTVVNGASIPAWLRPFVGHPWSESYKEAAVIHDHFCETRSRPWADVHRVFYEAMLANGVSPSKALSMYAAVYRFGPRWTDDKVNFLACSRQVAQSRRVRLEDITAVCATPEAGKAQVVWQPAADEAALKRILGAAHSDRSVEKIERLVDNDLAARGAEAVQARRLGLLPAHN